MTDGILCEARKSAGKGGIWSVAGRSYASRMNGADALPVPVHLKYAASHYVVRAYRSAKHAV